jgi:hypothetical protein
MKAYKLFLKFGFPTILLLAVLASISAIFSVDSAIYSMFTFVLVGVLVALLMPLINAMDNPKSLLVVGVGILGLLLIFLISWGITADNDVSTLTATKAEIKLAGALLNTLWVMLGSALLLIFGMEIKNLVGK